MLEKSGKVVVLRATQYGLCYTGEKTINPGEIVYGVTLIADKHDDPQLKAFLEKNEPYITENIHGFGCLRELFTEFFHREPRKISP